MQKITLILGFTLLAVFILASFLITRNSNGLSTDQMPVVVPPQIGSSAATSESSFDLKVMNLAHLEDAFYALWIIKGEQASRGGYLNIVDEQISFSQQSQESNLTLAAGDQVMITIESEISAAAQPAATVVLKGIVSAQTPTKVALNFSIDLSQARGAYLLATPTNSPARFETSGIWFVQTGGQAASLELPPVASGWQYEGWVFHQGRYLSSGRFSQPQGVDDFAGYSGTQAGPDFPGEDYLANLPGALEPPLELVDGESRVLVSLEPERVGVDLRDNSDLAEPYLIILEATIESGAADHTLYPLQLIESNLPSAELNLR